MRELLKQSAQYRVDTEQEVETLIDEAMEESNGVVEFSRKYKNTKKDGEFWIVDITEKF